jgi:glycosyltransferase involved in cell wall biosynthesis
MRVAILHPIPSPYREKLFEELSSYASIELKVYYCAQQVSGYRDWSFEIGQYEHECLPGREFGDGFLWNPSIVNRLARDHVELLVVWGWSYPTAQMALLWARLRGIAVLIFSDSVWPARLSRGLTGRAVALAKRVLLAQAQAYIAQGTLSRDYLVSLGAAPSRIHMLPVNCIETDRFRVPEEGQATQQNRLKGEVGLRGQHVILYVGRLAPGKGLFELLDAHEKLRQAVPDVDLLLVGGGAERQALETYIAKRGLEGVNLVGARPYGDLPALYQLADCFALPTFSDTWGVVVLEALASGLPVVTTTRCGSAPDLIAGRGTGLVVEPGDVPSLAEAMKRMILLEPREEIRQRCRAVASKYDCTRAAAELERVIMREANRAPRRPGRWS